MDEHQFLNEKLRIRYQMLDEFYAHYSGEEDDGEDLLARMKAHMAELEFDDLDNLDLPRIAVMLAAGSFADANILLGYPESIAAVLSIVIDPEILMLALEQSGSIHTTTLSLDSPEGQTIGGILQDLEMDERVKLLNEETPDED